METVEIIIYISLALIVGVLILNLVNSTTQGDMYEQLKEGLLGGDSQDFKEVDAAGMVKQVVTFWQQSGTCEVEKEKALYCTGGTNSFNKSYLFEKIKQLNLCSSIQSADYDCGRDESVTFPDGPINLPGTIRLSCNVSKGQLRIEG